MYRTFNIDYCYNNCILFTKQLTEEYPEILTPDNVWILGITQEPSTREYYLVFYYDVNEILDKFIRTNEDVEYMQYSDFGEIKQIGAGGYGTVYTAKYKYKNRLEEEANIPETVVLKRFKRFDETPELFISEVSNNNNSWQYQFCN